MKWLDLHKESEKYASLAEHALREGKVTEAQGFYKEAAQHELHSLDFIELAKQRTLGITVISTIALYYKAKEISEAEEIAHTWLGKKVLPAFANEEIKKMLQTIWSEKEFEDSGVDFVKGTVLVSVKGRMVVHGGAPLELILRKIDEVKSLFYRTIEMQLNKPFRKRGGPSTEIQDQFCPWLIQAPAGSYQFAVKIQKPKVRPLFHEEEPEAEDVTSMFFKILSLSSQDKHEELEELTPNKEYADAFLKLTRNLAPTGKSIETVEIKSVTGIEDSVVLSSESRKAINKSIASSKPSNQPESTKHQITGILRALNLNKDWIEVDIPGEERPVIIRQTGDVIDDVVGPMVNQQVLVDVIKTSEGKYVFQDIQLEE